MKKGFLNAAPKSKYKSRRNRYTDAAPNSPLSIVNKSLSPSPSSWAKRGFLINPRGDDVITYLPPTSTERSNEGGNSFQEQHTACNSTSLCSTNNKKKPDTEPGIMLGPP